MITLVTMETNDRIATLATLFTSKDFKDGDGMLNLNVNQHIRPKQNGRGQLTVKQSPAPHPGEKGALNKVLYGRLRPEVQPLTLSYTIFDRKGTRFVYLPLKKWYPFHIPT